jgi:hypothetical protein
MCDWSRLESLLHRHGAMPVWRNADLCRFCGLEGDCRMDIPGPTTQVGTRTDYSVGPWDYSTCAMRHLLT